MPFWTYMLHCRGGYFYVGHTDDLDRRIGEHKSGLIPGFTADHLPVELVWSEQFESRDDAKASERKLKGWSRAKKLALIRGDWERISALAKKKDSASTSSAWTGEGGVVSSKSAHPELVEGSHLSLLPHPETPALGIEGIEALFQISATDFRIDYRVFGAVPKMQHCGAAERSDGLWQTTCFELFVKPDQSNAYLEFNFAPGGKWAAYWFDDYRIGQADWDVRAPLIEPIENGIRVSGQFGLKLDGAARFGISAVIEEHGGTKSYWALAHPPGKPDFHHPACFAASLPALRNA